MSIRRLFWLGAAILFCVAALVAIVAVLGVGFGETQGRIPATCGIAFVCGAATLAGVACIDRGVILSVGWPTVAVGFAQAPPAAERLLGTLGEIEVLAVRGEGRSVTIGSSRTRLSASEGIVLRERPSA